MLGELADWAADGCWARSPSSSAAQPRADLDALVAEVTALTEAGMGVKDACARVTAANPGAPPRRELYDAVLRSRRAEPTVAAALCNTRPLVSGSESAVIPPPTRAPRP